MRWLGTIWQVVKSAANGFFEDDAMTLGAALAFYSALSFAPLVVLLLVITAVAGPDVRGQLSQQMEALVGPQAGEAVRALTQSVSETPDLTTAAGAIGFAALLFSATGAFAQLQYSLNRIWGVQARPDLAGVWAWLRKRLLSFGLLLAVAFLILVSLGVDTVLSALFGSGGAVWTAVSFVMSLAISGALFALMFRYLPDVEIGWNYIWLGAGLTAALFAVGKFAIGAYLGNSSIGSAYGAAGSLLVLLVWVYYSSLILFFGAELAEAVAKVSGARIAPTEHAVWIEDESQEVKHAG